MNVTFRCKEGNVKPITVLGLSLVAAMAFVGVVGTTMASAQTTLCKENKDPCPEAQRYPAGTVLEGSASVPLILGTYSGFNGTIDCLSSVVSGRLESSAGNPLVVKIEKLTFTGTCHSTFGGTCTVAAIKLGKINLSRTAANLGTAAFLGNEIKVTCGGFPSVDCVLGGVPLLHAEGSGVKELTALAAGFLAVSGSSCPSSPRWDAQYQILQPAGSVFISS
jgi:hypothetical protein